MVDRCSYGDQQQQWRSLNRTRKIRQGKGPEPTVFFCGIRRSLKGIFLSGGSRNSLIDYLIINFPYHKIMSEFSSKFIDFIIK